MKKLLVLMFSLFGIASVQHASAQLLYPQAGNLPAQIANAQAALPIDAYGNNVGDIVLAAGGPYTFSSTIHLQTSVTLDCQGAALVYTGTTGAAIAVYAAQSQPSDYQMYRIGKIKHCIIMSHDGYTSGNANIGVYLGGDPNGVYSPATAWGNAFQLEDADISGFYQGWAYGNNVWLTSCNRCFIHTNYDGVYSQQSGPSNAGEQFQFLQTVIYNNLHCGLNANNYEHGFRIEQGSFDYNGIGYGFVAGGHGDGGGICGAGPILETHGTHFEQWSGPLINIGVGMHNFNTRVLIDGGRMVENVQPSTGSNVSIDGSNVLTITIPSTTGLQVGLTELVSGCTNATFLNGQYINIASVASSTTFTAAFTHAAYSSTDTCNVMPVDPGFVNNAYVANLNDITLRDVDFHPLHNITSYVSTPALSFSSHICILNPLNSSAVSNIPINQVTNHSQAGCENYNDLELNQPYPGQWMGFYPSGLFPNPGHPGLNVTYNGASIFPGNDHATALINVYPAGNANPGAVDGYSIPSGSTVNLNQYVFHATPNLFQVPQGIQTGASSTLNGGFTTNNNSTSVTGTAATSGANHDSPYMKFSGTYWNGSASVTAGCSVQTTFDSLTGSNPNLIPQIACDAPSSQIIQFKATGGIVAYTSDLPSSTSGTGHVSCWKTTSTLGYCSTQPDSSGACTCN